MIKVKATSLSARNKASIRELGRIAKEGEEFYVTEDRYDVLIGNNPDHAVYVVTADPKPITVDVATSADIPFTKSDTEVEVETTEKAKPAKKTAKGKKDSAKVNTKPKATKAEAATQVAPPPVVKPAVKLPVTPDPGPSVNEFSKLKFDDVGAFTGGYVPDLDMNPYSYGDLGVDETMPDYTPRPRTAGPTSPAPVAKSRILKG